MLGVSYKPGVGDIRESPALKIIDLLQARGAEISYHDAYVPELPSRGLVNRDLDEAVQDADLVAIVTAHPDIDHARVARSVPIAVDFRGVTRSLRPTGVELS